MCASVLVVGAIDVAYGGMMGFVLFGMVLVGWLSLVHLVAFRSQWRRCGGHSLLPPLACLLVLPGIWTLGPRLLVARFNRDRAEYDALAQAIRSGGHPESLAGDERRLGHWVKIVRAREIDCAPTDAPACGRVVGVHFLAVSHGDAGHAGFMRVFEPTAAHHLDAGRGAAGWTFSERLAERWYFVTN